jgi:ppGpp synthetase/RelA/SpoT-type nucleotidyltranferase
MSIVDDFVDEYSKKYDYYYNLSKLVEEKFRKEMKNKGIKCIITSRAKDIDSLRKKLDKRDNDNKYKTFNDIAKDIVDLSGVRISLYFPSDIQLVNNFIEENFNILSSKMFPDKNIKNKFPYQKRFPGYYARHYRVELNDKDIESRFKKTTIEIQVASVLMLAWSEVEHDLVYKPNNGYLSDKELSILDEINGLVLAGEIALERLKDAIVERIENDKITNNYEITNLLMKRIKDKNINIGNTNDIMYFINDNKISDEIFKNIIEEISDDIIANKNYSLSDQIIDNILSKNIEKIKYFDDFIKYLSAKNNFSYRNGFENFLRSWILLEKILKTIGNKVGEKISPFNNNVGTLLELDKNESNILAYSRKARNEIVHGIESYPEEKLLELTKDLIPIIKKLINSVDESEKKRFIEEMNKINEV